MLPEVILETDGSASRVRVAMVLAEGVSDSSDWVLEEVVGRAVADAVARGEAFWPERRRDAVRDMLRAPNFKPTGRSKPSSEFLLNAAMANEFPRVSTLVDINNVVSLKSGFPASIFDLAKTGPRLQLRRGQEGESYVFNRAGHVIDLHDLVCVCRLQDGVSRPCGNPVKDCMETKVDESTSSVVAVIYVPADRSNDVGEWASEYACLLASAAGADSTRVVLP